MFPAVIKEKVGRVFLMVRFDCGMSSQAAALEGAGVMPDKESCSKLRSLAKGCTWGSTSGPAEVRLLQKQGLAFDDTVWFLWTTLTGLS